MKNEVQYEFITEEDRPVLVKLCVIRNPDCEKAFGIRARLFESGILTDEAYARNVFLTIEEASASLDMLKRGLVTPCTLTDVL